MVIVKVKGVEYDYPDKVMSTHIIDQHVHKDIAKFFSEHKIKKSTFLEELFKELLFMQRMGRLSSNNYILTVDLRRLGMRRFRMD